MLTLTSASFPKLDDVRGGFNLQTTQEFDCSAFDKLHSSGVIKGDQYICKAKLSEARSSEGGASTTGGSGSGRNNTKSAASGRVGINAFALLAGAAVLVL
jgi:hypothetical protein